MWYYANGIVGQQEIMSVCMFTFRFSEICSKAQKGVKNIVWLKRIKKHLDNSTANFQLIPITIKYERI